MPIAALFTTIFIGWRISKNETYNEFLRGSKKRWIVYPWFFLVRWVAPIAVIIIILQEAGIIKI